MLLSILILHQTTTMATIKNERLTLLSILILHQTTTISAGHPGGYVVVINLDSTSNHNPIPGGFSVKLLLSILILHQTTTLRPLQVQADSLLSILILHQTTTSP